MFIRRKSQRGARPSDLLSWRGERKHLPARWVALKVVVRDTGHKGSTRSFSDGHVFSQAVSLAGIRACSNRIPYRQSANSTICFSRYFRYSGDGSIGVLVMSIWEYFSRPGPARESVVCEAGMRPRPAAAETAIAIGHERLEGDA